MRFYDYLLECTLIQGAKLRKITGFPFGKPPKKIGFPKLLRAFRKHSKALYRFCFSKSLVFTGFPFGNPYQKNGFPTVFLGVPESRKASNFAPWTQTDYLLECTL